MKAIRKISLMVAALVFSACSPYYVPQQQYTANEPVSMQVFYDQLSPYGVWIAYPPYGYAWSPGVSAGFSPYATDGHWVYTRYGWTWYSYYAWGWAPFHYGRWQYDAFYGWLWIPDTTWGPAWVAWRMGDGYCGWAPLAPGVSVNTVINGGYVIDRDRWIFVRESDLSKRYVARHRVERSANHTIIQQAPVVHRVREERGAAYMPGPDRNTIQNTGGRTIREVELDEITTPGNGRLRSDRLELFKPDVRKGTNAQRPAPPRVVSPDEIKKRSGDEIIHNGQERPAPRRDNRDSRARQYKTPPVTRPARREGINNNDVRKNDTCHSRSRSGRKTSPAKKDE